MLRAAFVLLLLEALALPSSATAQAPPFLLSWGALGNGDGEFSEPRGVAVDASGNVYVTDYVPHARIQVFDPNGVFLRKWGSWGTAPGQFVGPEGIAIDGSGNVYVTDGTRVLKFAPDTTFLGQWGSYGTGDGQFENPRGIAIDASNNVYVTDESNCRVQKFTSSGAFLLKWDACTPVGVGPVGIAVEPAGSILVTIIGNAPAVRRFSSTGDPLGQIGGGVVQSPAAVDVDAAGNIVVADGTATRVLAFTSAGALIASWGSSGSGPGQFGLTYGIGVAPGGEIYVSDRYNIRISKFGKLTTPTLRSTWGKMKVTYR